MRAPGKRKVIFARNCDKMKGMSKKRRKRSLKKNILRIRWVRNIVDRMPAGAKRFLRNKYAVGSAVILVAILVIILVALSISTRPAEVAGVEKDEEGNVIYIIDEKGNRVAVSSVDDDSLVLQNEKYVEKAEEDPTVLAYNENTRDGYMNNCVFLGDSRTVAMVSYGFVSDSNALAKIGISHWQVLSTTFTQNSGNKYTLSDYLRAHSEPVIYVCYGVNGLNGMPEDKYESTYTELVDRIIELAGDRHIVLMSIWPVDDNGRYRGSVKNEWVDKYNEFLYGLAVEKGLHYLDVASILKDDNGSIKKEYDSGDGLHYKASAYNDILDYIIHHPVPGVSDEGEFVVHYVKPRGEYKEIMTEEPVLPQTTKIEGDDYTFQIPNFMPAVTDIPTPVPTQEPYYEEKKEEQKPYDEQNKQNEVKPAEQPTAVPTPQPTPQPTPEPEKPEEPLQEEPKQEEPKQEEPKQEEPKQEEPKQEEPGNDSPDSNPEEGEQSGE